MTIKSDIGDVKSSPSRKEVWRMFDRIAHRYDLLNRLLSGGQHIVWRKKVSAYLPEGRSLNVLDVATGTGDLLISMARRDPRVTTGVGIDMAEKMLSHGRDKLKQMGLSERLTLSTGDATRIPFDNEQFDATTISFGIRNVIDVPAALSEMFRVLRPGGRIIVLEVSLPANALMRRLYLFYFRHVLPKIGGLISGDTHAYQYLNKTVETFPYGESFCDLMRDAGFADVRHQALTLGIAAIYQGDRPNGC